MRPLAPLCTTRRGVALVLVLALIVLLVGVLLAFYSQSILQRQVAMSSANQTQVSVFAQGAIDTLVGDLYQEIVDGSTAETAGGQALYFPSSAAKAVPERIGTANDLPNLVKRSTGGQALYAGGKVRVATVPSSSPSRNGRYITLARWNSSLLLPKATPSSASDATPIPSFIAPDWIFVDRAGNNPLAWSTGLRTTRDLTQMTPVVGRYAFAVYDEGGLLDVNVSGYPASLDPLQASPKNYTAFADLTTLGMSASQIDALVGWRNYATTQPTGTFPSFTIAATGNTSFMEMLRNNSSGFLRTRNEELFNGQTDRMFSSRQQLIHFMMQGVAQTDTDRAALQNSLQYLGTFSRTLNQPSYRPDPNRPKVATEADGGNDAWNGDDVINPSFLKVRVASEFVRNDGSLAKTSEPLVKKRFALRRLAWLTHKGSIATSGGNLRTDSEIQEVITALHNAGYTDEFLKLGTPENIYRYFGLSWVSDPEISGADCWVYSHEASGPYSTPNTPAEPIRTLGGGSNPVDGREADFVELFRAGVNVGSIGSTSRKATAAGSYDTLYHDWDESTNAALLQIVANVIDQFDSDSYPSTILFNDGSSAHRRLVGIEDLPYFYRVRGSTMKIKESNPAFTAKTQEPVIYDTNTNPTFDPGLGVAFQQPEIWNPHAWNPNAALPGPRPTAFRITAVNAPPPQRMPSSPDDNQILTVPGNRYNSSFQTCPLDRAPISPISWTEESTALLFEIPSARRYMFREPTMLIRPNVPLGSNLRLAPSNRILQDAALAPYLASGGIRNLADNGFFVNNGVPDSRVYIGMYMGAFPLTWQVPNSAPPTIANAFVVPTANGKMVTYRLEYQQGSSWITYDTKLSGISMQGGMNQPQTSGSRPNWIDPSYAIGNDNGRMFLDPRTSRFGEVFCAWQYNQSRQLFEWPPTYSTYSGVYNAGQKAGAAADTVTYASTNAARQNALWTIRPDAHSGFSAYPVGGPNFFVQLGMGSANNSTYVFKPGLLSQNNMNIVTSGTAVNIVGQSKPGARIYFTDPDKVTRRGMAGYVPPSVDGSLPAEVNPASGAAAGLPDKVANTFSASGVATPNQEMASRPIILNRPFRSVGEIAYAHSGIPWRNVDLSSPESGFVALMDIFCINDTDDPDGLQAGQVNLNTRQAPVIQALLKGAAKDELTPATIVADTGDGSAQAIAQELVRRTSDTALSLGQGSGPLSNIADLVGRWVAPSTRTETYTGENRDLTIVDGSKSYSGFSGSATVAPAPDQNPPNLSYVLHQNTTGPGYTNKVVQRYRESVIRSLTANGQTRVWNLMVDLVAQTGRFPRHASAMDHFIVEGEQRLWVHLAVDRLTGKVIDRQIEVVKE